MMRVIGQRIGQVRVWTRGVFVGMVALGVGLGAWTSSKAQNLVVNGSFEEPQLPTQLRTYGPGNAMPGWTVEHGNVDLKRRIGAYIAPVFDGEQCLDLDGNTLGTISQVVSVSTPGRYRLSFGLTANTFVNHDAPRPMRVELIDLRTNTAVFTREYTWSRQNGHLCQTDGVFSFLSWECHQADVDLEAGQYRLRFVSLNTPTPGFGPMIDKVQLVLNGGDACAFDYPRCCESHNGDVNRDGCVDDADLLAVLFAFGRSGNNLGRVDVNCDQVVDDADLLIVLFNFGRGC